MSAPTRLGLYGLVLVVVFAVAAFTARAVVPDETVQGWAAETQEHAHGDEATPTDTGGHGGHAAEPATLGLGSTQDGYQLTAVSAPTEPGVGGELALTVQAPDGTPVTDFEVQHEKELHLITVRADGQHFAHVHPQMQADGSWTIPWQWKAAGTYRVFADFVPADTGEGVTLSTTLQVGGDFDATPAQPVAATGVDGYDVTVEGDVVAGEASELTMTITRDGQPVTQLERYLGASGHLVALRDGDLAYLHVHPHGDPPRAGETSGPEIVFEVTAPTEGRYLLYLDFKIGGRVHTAPLVVDTTGVGLGSGGEPTSDVEHEDEDDHDH